MNPYSLHGKTILVTGASSGIGRAVAIACSEMGAVLVITGRDEHRLKETFSFLKGVGHVLKVLDLTISTELKCFCENLFELDGFVHCAGIAKPLVLRQMEIDDVNEIMQINTFSPIHLTRLLIQNRKLKKESSLVYLSSINGNNSVYLGSSIYAASKSALNGFVKGVALELSSRGIRANCINPGMIDTNLLSNSAIGIEELNIDKQNYPLKRYGKPEEVAYAAVYLLSDVAKWITGTSIVIDGGYTLK